MYFEIAWLHKPQAQGYQMDRYASIFKLPLEGDEQDLGLLQILPNAESNPDKTVVLKFPKYFGVQNLIIGSYIYQFTRQFDILYLSLMYIHLGKITQVGYMIDY